MSLTIKGIGDANTRANEVKPSLDAGILKWIAGYDIMILAGVGEEFAVSVTGNQVNIASGLFAVHGYACYSDATEQRIQLYGVGTTYSWVYLEADLSVI